MKNTMKKIMRRSTAVLLAAVVMSVTPLSDLRPTAVESSEKNAVKAAETNDGKYISDIKLAMGEPAKIAVGEVNELEKHGYDVLMKNWDPSTKDGKVCANLNEGAGTMSYLKEGPNDKYVYLCYKTTDNPDEAITDMAVMNMNGGYSIEDYNALYKEYMNKKIIPFVESFVETLKEYRLNLKKSKSSPGFIRADYIRQMLNKLIDDDTGKPLGDLLRNQTKFEMGDKAYNKLSEENKKTHADIVTILAQANGQATLTLETLLTKAADASDDTWIDRLGDTTYEELSAAFDKENEDKAWGPEDLEQALDREYEDNAKKLLGDYDSENNQYMNWDSFRKQALEYDKIQESIEEQINNTSKKVEEIEKNDDVESMTLETEEDYIKVETYINEVDEVKKENAEQAIDLQTITVCDYLDSITYGKEGKTLLDFFKQDSSAVSGKNIKNLYPIVDALSAGQIAGLEFLSLIDLFSMAIADTDLEMGDENEESNKKLYEQAYELVKDLKETSIYEKVNRGIYDEGAVAITGKAQRQKASAAELENDDSYHMGKLPILLWSMTAAYAVATAVTVGIYARFAKGVKINFINVTRDEANQSVIKAEAMWNKSKLLKATELSTPDAYIEGQVKPGEAYVELGPTKLFKALTVGMALVTVVLILASATVTILDAAKYYNADFRKIPKFMVDEVDVTDKNGELIKNQTAYYQVVETSRANGPSEVEKKNYKAMGVFGDLNGDIGKQWLALYTVKYTEGRPILTNSLLYQYDSESVPKGYSTGIHEFGSTAACNLNNPNYLYEKSLLSKAKPPVIKLFYKTEAKTVTELLEAKLKGGKAGNTGSLFTKGYGIVIGGGILFVFLVGFAAVYGRRRRKAIEK